MTRRFGGLVGIILAAGLTALSPSKVLAADGTGTRNAAVAISGLSPDYPGKSLQIQLMLNNADDQDRYHYVDGPRERAEQEAKQKAEADRKRQEEKLKMKREAEEQMRDHSLRPEQINDEYADLRRIIKIMPLTGSRDFPGYTQTSKAKVQDNMLLDVTLTEKVENAAICVFVKAPRGEVKRFDICINNARDKGAYSVNINEMMDRNGPGNYLYSVIAKKPNIPQKMLFGCYLEIEPGKTEWFDYRKLQSK